MSLTCWLLATPSCAARSYVFLEYVPGGSIASLLKEFGTLDEPLVAVYTRQILQGLVYLHEKHIIHRDVKGAPASRLHGVTSGAVVPVLTSLPR